MFNTLIERDDIFGLFSTYLESQRVVDLDLGMQMAEYFRTFVMKLEQSKNLSFDTIKWIIFGGMDQFISQMANYLMLEI